MLPNPKSVLSANRADGISEIEGKAPQRVAASELGKERVSNPWFEFIGVSQRRPTTLVSISVHLSLIPQKRKRREDFHLPALIV